VSPSLSPISLSPSCAWSGLERDLVARAHTGLERDLETSPERPRDLRSRERPRVLTHATCSLASRYPRRNSLLSHQRGKKNRIPGISLSHLSLSLSRPILKKKHSKEYPASLSPVSLSRERPSCACSRTPHAPSPAATLAATSEGQYCILYQQSK
jgi:hypothetical protein